MFGAEAPQYENVVYVATIGCRDGGNVITVRYEYDVGCSWAHLNWLEHIIVKYIEGLGRIQCGC